MAVRQIRIMGDDILTKKCKPVKEMTGRTMELIEDMFETMYEANGCGLASLLSDYLWVNHHILVAVVHINDHNLLQDPNIGGSQTAAIGLVHGFKHFYNQFKGTPGHLLHRIALIC